ncbi:uncharacterized protein LOC105277121 [Ooceraea biroi]|uniref:uncharacterized protein LOC105277121 n=1 Tax=Ooceraea biroi TaxID=2015173 RepID=UPI000F084365|nr:uncharacterized protein LOC105277121 [Ooceraea biroi]
MSEESLSDHRFICFSVEKCRETRGSLCPPQLPRWALKKLDPAKLDTMTAFAQWGSFTPSASSSADDQIDELVDQVTNICDVVMPRVHEGLVRRSVYWWNNDISEARAQTNAARRRYTRARKRTDATLIENLRLEYTEARARYKRLIVLAQREAWSALLAQIDGDPWGRLYKVVLKKLRPGGVDPLATLPRPQVQEIVTTLFPPCIFSPLAHVATRPIPLQISWLRDDDPFDITPSELARVIPRVGSKAMAPGPDGIPGRI